MNLGAIVADVWEQVQLETPDPFRTAVFNRILGLPVLSYRDRLIAPQFNWRGDRIPQIALVRNNLVRLGKPRRPPRLP